MAKKKKPESMLARQRRLLREQRARKAAAKKALEKAAKAPKQLPGKGKTTASSNRAKVQRGLRRDRLARKQLETFARGMKKTLKQSAATDKLKKAAKGTKGTTVRTAQGKGDLVKRTSNLPASQRVEKVKVKVDPPKQLSPAKTKTTKALPSKSSAVDRRAEAKAKADKVSKGTRGTKTRVAGGRGLPKQTPQLPPASKLKDAARATAKNLKPISPALKGIAQVAGPIALGLEAGMTADDLAKSLQRGEGIARLVSGNVKQKPLKTGVKTKPANTSKRGAGSRASSKKSKTSPQPTTKPAKRRMSNIPPAEGYVNNPNYGKPGKVSKKVSKEVKPAGKVSAASSPKPKQPAPKKPTLREAAYAKDARNREYDKLRDAGKFKEAAALGKKIAADARKKASKNPFRVPQGKERKDRFSRDVAALKAMRPKKKKEPQSRALRAGYPGNRNY